MGLGMFLISERAPHESFAGLAVVDTARTDRLLKVGLLAFGCPCVTSVGPG